MSSLGSLLSLLFLFLALLHGHQHTPPGSVEFAKERTLVLVAHPDDECMFFAPTVVALTNQLYGPDAYKSEALGSHVPGHAVNKSSPEVFAFSISVGNADGLGRTRRKEFEKSTHVLGIPKDNVFILDHALLQDDILSDWDPIAIARVIKPIIENNNITTVLTFDHGGVSRHPNHRSLPQGVIQLLTDRRSKLTTPPPRLFTLTTVSLVSKYTGALAPVISKLKIHLLNAWRTNIFPAWLTILQNFGITKIPHPDVMEDIEGGVGTWNLVHHSSPVYISDLRAYFTTLRAMYAHRSQLVWFRYLYILFSRYMWVNDWVEVRHSS
ncbi:hypothetical protein AX16_005046 [Volvariella volvacea WC 439]|nr:hypothetical protein AX16_005046 [Volvariella volvacea WC 439]